jgi:predicted RNase H-like HicB family nuclease
MRYKVVLQKSEEGFSVSCPTLQGCWSQGETEEAALENIKDAIENYLLVLDSLKFV